MNTAQTVLTQGSATARTTQLSSTLLWAAVIAGVVLLVWLLNR
jgi:hypothetical protein